MPTSAEPPSVRILIAAAEPSVRDRCRRSLQRERGLFVVADSANAAEAIHLTASLNPDVLFVDWSLPPAGGADVLHGLVAASSSTKPMILVERINRSEAQVALRLGARGLLLKDFEPWMMIRAIRGVMDGQYWFPHEIVADALQALRNVLSVADFKNTRTPVRFRLTRREIEIVAAITAGYTNKDIALRFSISENTVKHHLSSIFEKLGLSNRLELAVFAVKNHLELS